MTWCFVRFRLRLNGNGLKALMLYHSCIDIPLPPTKSTYLQGQYSLMLAPEEFSKKELCRMQGIDESHPVRVVASYDGAYQQRGGKTGGGHSRYAFASAISIDTAKVLSYGVACNSCMLCSKHYNLLRNDKISKDEYDKITKEHSQIFLQFFPPCFPFIQRFERLSHVVKRLKTNLCNTQGKVLKSCRSEKAFEIKQLKSKAKDTTDEIKRMVKKTEVCGMDVMRLASSLAVIQFNDGFSGIKHFYEVLGLDITDRMNENFRKFDLERVTNSFNIIKEQRLRYKKKQDRGKTVKKQIEKHGYSSGKYTAAKIINSDEASDSGDYNITIHHPEETLPNIQSSATHSTNVS